MLEILVAAYIWACIGILALMPLFGMALLVAMIVEEIRGA
jgi:hypothetical protein